MSRVRPYHSQILPRDSRVPWLMGRWLNDSDRAYLVSVSGYHAAAAAAERTQNIVRRAQGEIWFPLPRIECGYVLQCDPSAQRRFMQFFLQTNYVKYRQNYGVLQVLTWDADEHEDYNHPPPPKPLPPGKPNSKRSHTCINARNFRGQSPKTIARRRGQAIEQSNVQSSLFQMLPSM